MTKINKNNDYFSKNDSFRLIFLTKSVSVSDFIHKTFEVVFIDEVKMKEEDILENLTRKAPSEANANKLG